MSSTIKESLVKVSVHKPKLRNGHTTGQTAQSHSEKSIAGASKQGWQILWIAVDSIDPNPFQPRLSFDELEMQELIASVRAKGVQQPVLVRTAKNDNSKAAPKAVASNGNSKTGSSSNGQSMSTPLRSATARYVTGRR